MYNSMSSPHRTLAERLRRARVRKGLTQVQLAGAAGLNHAMVSKIESSQRRLDALEFMRLCRVLHLEPASFLDLVGWPEPRRRR